MSCACAPSPRSKSAWKPRSAAPVADWRDRRAHPAGRRPPCRLYERLAPLLSPNTPSMSRPTGGGLVSCRGSSRFADRLAQPRKLRRLAVVQLGPFARAAPARCRYLVISDADNNARLLRGLEIGVNDYLLRPVDKKRIAGARAHPIPAGGAIPTIWRDNVQNSIEMATTDALTGLHNRRYMESHLATSCRAGLEPAGASGVDDPRHRFLQGHQRQSRPRRRRRVARICRPHPQVDPRHRSRSPLWRRGVRYRDAGNRLARRGPGGGAGSSLDRRRDLAIAKGTKRIEVTVSIGLSTLERKGEAVGDVLKRADTALPRQA